MLKIESLSYAFDHQTKATQLFDQLNLELVAGQHMVIVGDSGCGKSTLLRLIADRGHDAIVFAEHSRLAMVMQQGALLDHLNVIDNLKIVARYAKRDQDEQSLIKLLQQLNIGSDLWRAEIKQLSGGQMRRVAIARALVIDPELVLFDEPDAGLDSKNLNSLANTVNTLTRPCRSQQAKKACITVSHNPFYIAQVADRVYRLCAGKLVLIADWHRLPDNDVQVQQRQLQLQSQLLSQVQSQVQSPQLQRQAESSLAQNATPKVKITQRIADSILVTWLRGCVTGILGLFHWPRSLADELRIASYAFYLSFITGIVFYALVGLMLGSTTIAVVKLLSDNALTGLLGFFIGPEMLLEMMGGIYVLYLAPAIGGMLFAARSGSIMSNWLGEMVRARQVQALRYLGVIPAQYLTTPSVLAVFLSMLLTIVWFAVCVWIGGLIAATQLFNHENPINTMSISQYDIASSSFWFKTSLYSAMVSITIISLGMAAKTTAHQVNIYTTKAIIYSTLSIAFAELIIILS